MQQNLDNIIYQLNLDGYNVKYTPNYPTILLEIEAYGAVYSFTLLESDIDTPKSTLETYRKILKGISEVG